MGATVWSCRRCGTTDATLRYRSGKIGVCYTCQAFDNIVINARQKHGKAAANASGEVRLVSFDRDEFLDWAAVHPRVCEFCGIDDLSYWLLDLRSATGKRLEALGIDRVDNAVGYDLENLVWCCYPCNRAKGNVLTLDEMRVVGVAFRQIWEARLAGR